MENRMKLQWGLVCLGGMVFNALFWEEELSGPNLLIFVLFVVLGQRLVFKNTYSLPASATLLGALLASAMTAWHGSAPAILGTLASIALSVGFMQHERLRSIFYAGLISAASGIRTPITLAKSLTSKQKYQNELSTILYYTRLVVLPLVIFLVFMGLFRVANPVFDGYMSTAFDWVGIIIDKFWEKFAPTRLVFLLVGLIISGWLFMRHKSFGSYADTEAEQPEQLVRVRKKRSKWLPGSSIIGLKNEHRMGVLAMGMVSLMAFAVNLIDLRYVWFSFEYDDLMGLKNSLHESTYTLIFSILLSMAIILYYFRGNQNFYLKADSLRWLAYIWILQNTVMAISVGIRNYHYIANYGLAYKRIGVVFFLMLTLFGLATLAYKIAKQRSIFFLLRTNAWAAYSVLLMLGCVNWDVLIASHNLNRDNRRGIGAEFLLSLSDKALPVLFEHEEEFKGVSIYWHGKNADAHELLLKKRERFLNYHNELSWLSWSWAERQAVEALLSEESSMPESVGKVEEAE